MKEYRVHITLIVAMLLHVSAYSVATFNFWLSLGMPTERIAFYFFAFSALAYCTYMLAFYFKADTKGLKSIVAFIGALYVSNLFDVLFFDRRLININEYAGALAALIIAIIEYHGWHTLLKQKMTNFMDKLPNMTKRTLAKFFIRSKFVRK